MSLWILEQELVRVVAMHGTGLVEALTVILHSSNLKSRADAALLVRSMDGRGSARQ